MMQLHHHSPPPPPPPQKKEIKNKGPTTRRLSNINTYRTNHTTVLNIKSAAIFKCTGMVKGS
jgi:hypothetical protein